MKYDNLILYDWFSFTAKHHTAESLITKVLGMDIGIFEYTHGVKGYADRLYFDGININFGGREEVWCEMSGQGCRSFETHGRTSWKTLFEEVLSDSDYHITRLDVAFDDHVGIFDLEQMAADVRAGNYVSEFKWWKVDYSCQGITIYHGSPSSNVRFRIYDKAAERNREDEGHWVRFEIQLRRDHAARFLNLMVLQSVGEVFAKTVNNYIRYVKPDRHDSNKRRWETADYWYRFIHVSEKISLYQAPGTEYNIDNLEHYVVNQAGAAVAAYVRLVGVDSFIAKCEQKFNITRNPKYQELISRYLSLFEDGPSLC